MYGENQVVPLAPSKDYPRSNADLESAMSKIKASREKKASKCLVYILAGIVILGTIFLVFASVVRPRTPDVEIGSVSVKNLRYGNASVPSFNLTMVTKVKVKNSNFGYFKFDNTTGRVYYGTSIVGDMKMPTGRVEARATKWINVTVDLRSSSVSDTENLSSDINSGSLELIGKVKLSGEVSVMDILKRSRNPEMTCFITLNLTSRGVQDVACK